MTVPNSNFEIDPVILTAVPQNVPLNFTIREASDVKVIRNDTTVLTNISDYTVNIPELGALGDVDILTGQIGDKTNIILCPECDQDSVYIENDAFPAKRNERDHDKTTQLACKALGFVNTKAIRYPDSEVGTNNIVPSKSDRIAGGNGTVFGWNGTSGAPDVLSKGSLDLTLTLSNDSTLGGGAPDAVNGATQAAVRNALNGVIAGAGLTALTGAYPSQVGKNFIATASDLNDADCKLDAAIQLNKNAILSLDSRVTTLEGSGYTFIAPATLASGTTAASATVALPGAYATANNVQLFLYAQTDDASSRDNLTIDISVGGDNYGTRLQLRYDTSGATGKASQVSFPIDTSITKSVTYTVSLGAGSPINPSWSIEVIGTP